MLLNIVTQTPISRNEIVLCSFVTFWYASNDLLFYVPSWAYEGEGRRALPPIKFF